MTEDFEPDHEGLCNLCGITTFWQPAPTGGWWIHDWPSKEVEDHFKTTEGWEHNADPGWKPEEIMNDAGEWITTPTTIGCTDNTIPVQVPHDFWAGQQ